MFKPNTVQVPRAIIKAVNKGKMEPEHIYFAALRMMYPRKSSEELADSYNIDDDVVEEVDEVLGQAEEREAPQQKRQTRQSQGQQKQYPKSPQAPDEFVEWFKETYKEVGFDKKIADNTINAIYEKFEGDEEWIEAAMMITMDFHENQSEVNSPGGFILRQAEDTKERAMYKVDLIENQGTAIKNRESRMNRAKQRGQKYLSKSEAPDYSGDYVDDDEEEADDD